MCPEESSPTEDSRVKFAFPSEAQSFSFLPYHIPRSHARSQEGVEGAAAYLHLHPPHAHDIVLDDDRDGICPPCKRNTHRGGQQPGSSPQLTLTHWVWVVRDLALECRDQKATVNQTRAILTAYRPTCCSAPSCLQLNGQPPPDPPRAAKGSHELVPDNILLVNVQPGQVLEGELAIK